MTARRAFSAGAAQPSRPPRLVADIDLAQVSDLELEQAGKSMRRLLEWSWSNGTSNNAIVMGAIGAFWFLIAAEQRRRRKQLQNCRFKFANHSQHQHR